MATTTLILAAMALPVKVWALDLNVQPSNGNCIEVSLSEAFSSEVFEATELRGNGNYQGDALELSIKASAELSAGVEICITIDQPLLVRPTSNLGPLGPQRMVIRRFSRVQVNRGPVEIDVEVSPSVSAGAELEATLEAYCYDENRREPRAADRFEPLAPLGQNLSRVLSAPYARGNLQSCVWAARASSPDFMVDLFGSYEGPPDLSPTQLRELLAFAERGHRASLLRCPEILDSCFGRACEYEAQRSSPWTITEVRRAWDLSRNWRNRPSRGR
ncbi:MAG: hypothetical protein AAF559_14490 [Pseudomonadota bacterium]